MSSTSAAIAQRARCASVTLACRSTAAEVSQHHMGIEVLVGHHTAVKLIIRLARNENLQHGSAAANSRAANGGRRQPGACWLARHMGCMWRTACLIRSCRSASQQPADAAAASAALFHALLARGGTLHRTTRCICSLLHQGACEVRDAAVRALLVLPPLPPPTAATTACHQRPCFPVQSGCWHCQAHCSQHIPKSWSGACPRPVVTTAQPTTLCSTSRRRGSGSHRAGAGAAVRHGAGSQEAAAGRTAGPAEAAAEAARQAQEGAHARSCGAFMCAWLVLAAQSGGREGRLSLHPWRAAAPSTWAARSPPLCPPCTLLPLHPIFSLFCPYISALIYTKHRRCAWRFSQPRRRMMWRPRWLCSTGPRVRASASPQTCTSP